MAVSHDDRISSARLLDAFKGLQNDEYLGKEPDVESVSYQKVVVPAVGSYSQDVFLDAFTSPNDAQLPFRVYQTPMNLNTDPIVISEPTGNYTEVTKSAVIYDINAYVEESYADIAEYTGYAVVQQGDDLWFGMHFTNGVADTEGTSIMGIILYQWVMPAKTVTTTTKHPIAQKYLPNADWNQNDPDGDGYIEGRPFYTETVEGQEVVHKIDNKYIADASITSSKIATQAVTGAKIEDKTITVSKFGDSIAKHMYTCYPVIRRYYDSDSQQTKEVGFEFFTQQDNFNPNQTGYYFCGCYIYGTVKELFGDTVSDSNGTVNTKIEPDSINNKILKFNTKNFCNIDKNFKSNLVSGSNNVSIRFYGNIIVKENNNVHQSPIYFEQHNSTTEIHVIDTSILQYLTVNGTNDNYEVHIYSTRGNQYSGAV